MEKQNQLPDEIVGLRGGILVVEAERGQARADALKAWAERLNQRGQDALYLAADFRESGVWSGVNDWVGGILPRMEAEAPALAEEHRLVISTVLPDGNRAHPELATLTEMAVGAESVRNFALDRAYRIPHGVIDLIDAWYTAHAPAPRVVIADGFDRGGALARRFFRDLVRRRGEKLGFTMVLVVSPGAGDATLAEFVESAPRARMTLDVPADAPGLSPRSRLFASVAEVSLARGLFPPEDRFPDLLRYWEEAGEPAEILPWMAYALGRFNHYGFYEDALLFLEPVAKGIDVIPATHDFLTRWNVVGALFNCLVAVGEVERGYKYVLEEALAKITDPLDRARACYIAAMVNARYSDNKDFDLAERYLNEGLAEVEKIDPKDEQKHFMRVFIGNGMALVRTRQGKPQEAVQICSDGYDLINQELGHDKHRLHRSVLLYNIAQVYTATREHEKALLYFGKAMEMDPNYSEYYNERGNVYAQMGRYDDAVRDYHDAIRVSAPYQEVWTNLGQCYRKMGKAQEAVEAYSRALDLDPAVEVARVSRAQMLSALGRVDEAAADYEAALAQNPAQPLVLANLAVLRYKQGRMEDAAGALDRAIEQAPGNPALHRNRAAALEELGRHDDAARDLETFLSLAPGAPDRAAVEEKIASLRGSLALA
jgi:tetratricopeptide (TPR) repeat protein